MKQTVVFDFDGVINSYKSGWQGLTYITDEPVEGIREAIAEIRKAGYEVIVVSTRCADYHGKCAVIDYLKEHEIEVDDVRAEKPPAIVYIDDRVCFDGNPETLLSKIKGFQPWYKKENADGCAEREALNQIYDIAKRFYGDCVAVNITVNSEGITANPIIKPFTIGSSMKTIDGKWLERRRQENE